VYLCKRLLIMVPTLIGVLTLTFLVTQLVPGGPVETAMARIQGEGAHSGSDSGGSGVAWSYSGRRGIDAAQVERLNAQYGFDQPLFTRYVGMLKRFLSFDLGESYHHHREVSALIREKLAVTASLGVWTFLLTYLISVPLGVAKAVRAGSRFDFVTSLIVLTGYAMPGFILGVLLIVLFGGGSFWDLFPLRGLTSDNWHELSWPARILDYLWHITLPLVASVISLFAMKTLLTKNMFLEELHRQYVLTARAKGLSQRGVLWRHVFRNTLLPIVAGFPATFIGAFLTGSLLIENLFSLDGLGLLSFESLNNRDYPVVLGTLYLFTLIGLLIKLAGDIAYLLVDPRVKFSAQGS
jgi:peptide/nickel transport system permease protein/microcin C transport system permease protein